MNTVYVTPVNGTIILNEKFFATIPANTQIVIPDGTYQSAKIDVPAGARGISIVPESEGGVTFTGRTNINLEGDKNTISGFTFNRTREDTIVVTGDGNVISGNHFVGAGDPANTQNCVVWIDPLAQNTKFIDNEVESSISMTIKIRADEWGSAEQPTNTLVEGNYFHDIKALSENGQEVIQIAGPGGQWIAGHDLELGTIIRNNIFYKTEGDVEAVSMKVGGTTLTNNLFMSMDAAPTVRNGGHNTIEGNILIDTRPLRMMGDSTEVTNNVILNPREVAILLANGTPRYEVAEDNTIRNNLVYSDKDISVLKIINQTSGTPTQVRDNVITDNAYAVTDASKLYHFTTTGVSYDAYFAKNTIDAGTEFSESTLAWVKELLADSADPEALFAHYLTGDGIDVLSILSGMQDVAKVSYDEFTAEDVLIMPTKSEINGTLNTEKLVGTTTGDLFHAGAGDDSVLGGIGDDVAHGGTGDDFLQGQEGHDVLFGEAGNDKLHGHEGNDTLVGGSGDDILRGGEGNDVLHGCAGDDKLVGQEGNDTLVGGKGLDTMMGAEGADVFAFTVIDAEIDAVKDFNVTEKDMIDISTLLVGFDKNDDIHDFVSLEIKSNKIAVSIDVNGGANDFVHAFDVRSVDVISESTFLDHLTSL